METFFVVVFGTRPVRLRTPPGGEVLKLNGVGFKSFLHGGWILAGVGYSHYVGLATPTGAALRARRGGIALGGGGPLGGRVQDLRRPDPYKGRGIYSVTRGKPPTKPGKRR